MYEKKIMIIFSFIQHSRCVFVLLYLYTKTKIKWFYAWNSLNRSSVAWPTIHNYSSIFEPLYIMWNYYNFIVTCLNGIYEKFYCGFLPHSFVCACLPKIYIIQQDQDYEIFIFREKFYRYKCVVNSQLLTS